MTSVKNFILLVFLLAATAACQNTGSQQQDAATDETAQTAEETSTTAKDEKTMTLKAKFVEFTLGDAAHFIFEDEAGKQWDFGGCDDDSMGFARELPEAEANTSNQGWGSNEALQNKWFDLKYVIRVQPLYIDGPDGEVMVITEAKPAQ